MELPSQHQLEFSMLCDSSTCLQKQNLNHYVLGGNLEHWQQPVMSVVPWDLISQDPAIELFVS